MKKEELKENYRTSELPSSVGNVPKPVVGKAPISISSATTQTPQPVELEAKEKSSSSSSKKKGGK